MSRLDADIPQAMHNVPPFTEKQREKLRAFFEANPDGGYKTALHHIGIRATRPAAKEAILADDDLAESIERYKGLHEASLDVKLGAIVQADGHKDQLNAIKFAYAIKHGVTEKQALQLTGADDGPLQIIVESAFPKEDDDTPEGSGSVHGEPETG